MPTLKAPNNKQIPWPPAGGIQYTVQKKGVNGESFIDIANNKNVRNEKGEIDVWKLIAFNFQTRSPNDVNFILKNNFPTARPCRDGVNYMFSGNETIYLPPAAARPPAGRAPTHAALDIDELADDLDIEVDDLNRFLNQYGWLNDATGGSLGLITEFAGLDILGALNTVLGNVTGLALFVAFLHRLDEQDEISMSLYAACYQLADWVATPGLHFNGTNMPSPKFPENWVRVNFLGVASNEPFPESKRRHLEELRKAWETGAAQVRSNLSRSLQMGYANCLRVLARRADASKEQPSYAAYEDLIKVSLLGASGGLKYGDQVVRGTAVANYFWARLKPKVELKSNFAVNRVSIPYPSIELNDN